MNVDLNTTYIRSIQHLTPIKLKGLKDLGVHIEGKRTQINDYVLLKNIGSGGWSEEVYLAFHVNTKQKYVDSCDSRQSRS